MYYQILNKNQKEMLSKLKIFKKDFYLAGGTAIALHIGHRKSIDLDFFSENKFKNLSIYRKLKKIDNISNILIDNSNEYTVIISNVKITFLNYPFPLNYIIEENDFKTLDLLSLAALKAYALGRRAKWKDYVDLYFIFQKYSLQEVVKRTKEIFKNAFNEKNFYQQLSYFKDIDYSEEVDFIKGFEKSDKEIKRYLKKLSLSV